MKKYEHTQFGTLLVWGLGSSAAVVIALTLITPAPRLVSLSAIPVALCVWLFSRLTITIDNDKVRAAFGPGLVRKTVPLQEIVSCEPVRIKWWEGWGIHLSRFGRLYNVSGWDAVAIRLRNGKGLALGTDQPNELAAAIRRSASAR